MTSRVASTASPAHRTTVHRKLCGIRRPCGDESLAREFDLGGVTLFRRLGNIESPEQLAGLAFDSGASAGSCRPGSASTRKAVASRGCDRLHGVAPHGSPGSQRQSGAGEEVCRRAGGRTGSGRYFARLRPGARHPHQSEKSHYRRPRTGRDARRRREARPHHHRRAPARRCGRVRQTLSRSRRHRDRFASRAPDCRASARPPARGRIPAVQGGDRRGCRVHHDRACTGDDDRRRAPATLSPKIVQRILREELGFTG